MAYIINSRADLDAAPKEIKESFMLRLASSINNWDWQGGEWVKTVSTNEISNFDFTLYDFPNAPIPEKPNYNPDEREAQEKASQAMKSRQLAYQMESDPIFFLAQRGEATMQDWQDKIAEIKSRFPKN